MEAHSAALFLFGPKKDMIPRVPSLLLVVHQLFLDGRRIQLYIRIGRPSALAMVRVRRALLVELGRALAAEVRRPVRVDRLALDELLDQRPDEGRRDRERRALKVVRELEARDVGRPVVNLVVPDWKVAVVKRLGELDASKGGQSTMGVEVRVKRQRAGARAGNPG